MNPRIAAAVVFVLLVSVRAAELPSLRFGGEPIGIPPLSLADRISQGMKMPAVPKFGAQVPQFVRGPESGPLPPAQVPPVAPETRQLGASKLASTPRVSLSSGMPIVEPRTDVDYKLRIIAPNPAIDFKLAIKDPSLKDKPVDPK